MIRHPNLLNKDSSLMIIIDIQEKLFRVMPENATVLSRTEKLIKACQILGIPFWYTEQYPKGLGSTVQGLADYLSGVPYFKKIEFSIGLNSDFVAALENSKYRNIVLAGIETHVCVFQSALDLQQMGFKVYIIRDAVCSRYQEDHKAALERMQQQNITITTSESVLFEWLQKAGTEQFKKISALIK